MLKALFGDRLMRLFSMSGADGRDSKNAMEGKCSPPSSVEGGDRLQLTIVTSDELSGVTTPPPKPTSCAKQPTSAIRRIVLRENVGDCVWVA